MSDRSPDEWKYSLLGPRKHTEVQQVDDGVNQGAIVRTIEERAIVGVPAGQLEEADADEIDRILAEFSSRFNQLQAEEDAPPMVEDVAEKEKRASEESIPQQLDRQQFTGVREDSVKEIRQRASKEVNHFEAARQKLHNLLHKPGEPEPNEIKAEPPPEEIGCRRCDGVDLDVLMEENTILKRKLAQSQVENKEEFTCKCQMKQKVDKLKREEQALLETIALKLERMDALKAQDHVAELTMEQTKMKLCTRLAENKRVESLLQAAEDSFNFKCKQMKEFQDEGKRSEERLKKLREETRFSSARHLEAEKRAKSLNSQLTKLQVECRAKEETLLKQRSTMVHLDDTGVKLRSEIQNLKDELQMLAESLNFHRQELVERGKEARALKMDEQQAEKQLEEQRRVTEAHKQAVATEMERSKALEFVAHNCLKESEEMSKALQRLRCSKREVEVELQELKSQIGCKEAQIEAEVDRLETLQATLQGLGDERRNVGNMLLQQTRKDKEKIKALLDDIDSLGALLCEAISIRSLIEKDNKMLEANLERSKCPSDQAQGVFDLEQQIDKHQRLIAALGEKVGTYETAHQDWGQAANEEKVVRLTFERVKTLSQDPPE